MENPKSQMMKNPKSLEFVWDLVVLGFWILSLGFGSIGILDFEPEAHQPPAEFWM
ncbi:hypothetical protein HY772_02085 [Candidatus Woesearchaeota archaeon]|nr:hypothetical protein [Candidatus Woesearchaeota archaeon]